MKILNAIIVIAVLVSNSAQAFYPIRQYYSVVKKPVNAKLATYGLPNLRKLDQNYLAQQLFNAGVELSQEEIFSLTEWNDSFIDEITGWSKGDASELRKLSLKALYKDMVAGDTGIAETMIDKGVDLGKVDLQALLYDVLKKLALKRLAPSADKVSTKWRDWLLAHGADINEPMFNLETAVLFLKMNDGHSLDWLLGNSEVAVEQLNELLSWSMLLGSYRTYSTLIKHGASHVSSDITLQVIMLERLFTIKELLRSDNSQITEKNILAGSFADFVNASPDTLNYVLEVTAEIVPESNKNDGIYITAMDKLLELGASIDTLDLQKLLYDALGKKTPVEELAKWAIKHGANINELDLNSLVELAIFHISSAYVKTSEDEEVIDARSFFVLLHKLGMDTKQLNLPQLLEEAEKEDRRIKRFKGEGAPTTGYVELLRSLQQD